MAHPGVNDRGVLNGQGPALHSSSAGYARIELYHVMVRGGDHVPTTLAARQDKGRARLMFEHYECMITQEEKDLLMCRDADQGKVMILKEHLNHLVISSLIWCFAAQKVCTGYL